MDLLTELEAHQRAAVTDLVAAAQAADGVRPLNDEALLDLERTARHWLRHEGDRLVGYGQRSATFGTAQLVVHPEHRGRGHGRALADAALADGASGLWAFGDLAPARGLAASLALEPERSLLIMARRLTGVGGVEAPEGIRLRSFDPDADAAAFLGVNARAFAGHPEQGAFGADDLAARMAEDWWDPAGLIVAEDADGLVGFHWTKRHDERTGEVYVIGVDPRAAGRGLGTVLLDAGLAHLAGVGLDRALLYVEQDNPAVRLYERTGFAVEHRDVLYRA